MVWHLTVFAAAWVLLAPLNALCDTPATRPSARISIVDCGAVADGKTLNTSSIQAAIDKAAATEGGATVVVPAGTFRTGALFLKAGVALHLEKAAVLLGSTDIADYPQQPTRIEGQTKTWVPALINAHKIKELRISGEGTLDGNGPAFWETFWQRRAANGKTTNLDVPRPRLLFISECDQAVISGVRLKDSGFWNLHLYRCANVTVDGLDIRTNGRGPSTDGIDVDSCQRVTIKDCRIRVNDDCIALKGTKGPLAMEDKESPPVEEITISGCVFEGGHGAVTFGSEATVVRNITVDKCTVSGNMPVLRLKMRTDTPQTYEKVAVRNLTLKGGGALLSIGAWSQFANLQGRPAPKSSVEDIQFSHIRGSAAGLGTAAALERVAIEGITFEDVELDLKSDTFVSNGATNVSYTNVRINGKEYAGK